MYRFCNFDFTFLPPQRSGVTQEGKKPYNLLFNI